MNLFKGPGKQWRLLPVPESSFGLYFERPPCLFHRLMQRLLLGFRWERE